MRERRSLRGKIAGVLYRAFTKRRPPPTSEELARQARRIMGLPWLLSAAWVARHGIKFKRVHSGGVICEYLHARGVADVRLLYLHGGGYLSCSPQSHRPNTVTLTRLLKAETYVPDYRLAPEHPFPAAVDDTMRVYRAICAAPDAKPIILAGDSAGGGLAIAAAICARDEGLPPPSSVLTFSPWVDLTPGREPAMRDREHLDDMFYAESFAAYADAYLQGQDPHLPLASPLFAELTDLPPLLIEVSDTELLYREALQLRDRWADAGNIVTLNASAGLPHGWQEVTPIVPEARESLQRAAEFGVMHCG
ncbi:MAG: alpha/beta hydrolase fold domain-containing protein [Chthoniobacterales bacterium]